MSKADFDELRMLLLETSREALLGGRAPREGIPPELRATFPWSKQEREDERVTATELKQRMDDSQHMKELERWRTERAREDVFRDWHTKGTEIYRAPEDTKVVAQIVHVPEPLTAAQWALGQLYTRAKSDKHDLLVTALELTYPGDLLAYYKTMGLVVPDRLVPAGEDWSSDLTDTADEEVELWG